MKKAIWCVIAVAAFWMAAGGFLYKTDAQAAGTGTFVLVEDGVGLGSYDSWQDVTGVINSAGKSTGVYHVLLAGDAEITGNMKMPVRGRYAGIVIGQTDQSGAPVTGGDCVIRVTGNVPMTGNLVIGDGITLYARGVAGGAYRLTVGDDAGLYTKGAVTAGTLTLGDGAELTTGGKLTVKKVLEASGSADITLTEKKGASIKDTVTASGLKVRVHLQDNEGMPVTPVQDEVLFRVTGDSYTTQYTLTDADSTVQTIYRKGNTLRVLGAQQIAATLYDETDSGANLGDYLSLADVRAEIGRRKKKTDIYRVEIKQPLFVKGNLPLPAAKTYEKIIFAGEEIRLTGSMKLTGKTEFENALIRVKSAVDDTVCPLNVNLAAYRLTVGTQGGPESVGNVSGGKGSVLELEQGVFLKAAGNLKTDRLELFGELQVAGSFTAGNITAGAGNGLYYNADKKSVITGLVEEDGDVLWVAPQRNGQLITSWPEGATVMNSVPKADVMRIALLQGGPYTLYRDKNVLKLGRASILVFDKTTGLDDCRQAPDSEASGKFGTLNDLITHVNLSGEKDFVARIEEDTPSGGRLIALEAGKHLILCSPDGERKKLRFTGSVVLNGSTLEVRGVIPDNSSAAGTPYSLKNGATLLLEDTEVKTISAGSGTAVVLAGDVTVKGAVSGKCDLTILQGAVIRGNGNVTAGTLTLADSVDTLQVNGTGNAKTAEVRLLSGKKISVSGAVSTAGDRYFTINMVDRQDALADIGRGTVLVAAKEAGITQFTTHNIMPGMYQEWFLIKKGNNICTSLYSYGNGEWSGDFL